MKCYEIPPISTNMGEFGRIPPQGGDTLPETLLNIILLQPSEKPTRACDCNFSTFHVNMNIHDFHRIFKNTTIPHEIHQKSDFGTSKYLRTP